MRPRQDLYWLRMVEETDRVMDSELTIFECYGSYEEKL